MTEHQPGRRWPFPSALRTPLARDRRRRPAAIDLPESSHIRRSLR
ncbi:MAG TPA: hypothetical protein VF743_08165 [Acidimicrobiales bacterium]